jgi:hypothetical protein
LPNETSPGKSFRVWRRFAIILAERPLRADPGRPHLTGKEYDMKRGVLWFAALVVLVAATVALTQVPDKGKADNAAERRPADGVIFSNLRDVINRGVDLYNAGDAAGCYRLYEGSLLTVRPFLDNHPDLQKTIATALTAAERDPLTWRRAFTLRSALDKVRAELNPKKKPRKDTDEDKVPAPRPEDKKKADETTGKKPGEKDAKKGEDKDDKKDDKKKEKEDKPDDAKAEVLPPPAVEPEKPGGKKDT